MRMISGPIRTFDVTIRFKIWVAASLETEHTYEDIIGCVRKAFNEEPWVDMYTDKSVHHSFILSSTPFSAKNVHGQTFGPDKYRESDRYRFSVLASLHALPKNMLPAYEAFMFAADRRLRENPPRGCYDIYTEFHLKAFLGPENHRSIHR